MKGSAGETVRLGIRHIFLIISATAISTLVVGGLVDGISHDMRSPLPGNPCSPEKFSEEITHADYLYLYVFVDHATNSSFYFPANFTVPSQTLIHVTLTNYDPGPSKVLPLNTNVCGTLNGTMTMDGHEFSDLPADNIAHTFTITNGIYSGFNVPVPPASDDGRSPAVVDFSAYFDHPGVFRWEGDADTGQVSGLMTVT